MLDKAGLEGMVSKRKDSKYRRGPSTNWLKAKCYAIDDSICSASSVKRASRLSL
ncbi:hypothetical protein [Mesorhizobium sp. M0676]|uniref:hypothetical protein n=1 Tax=Mesorhizobium sp. M0676 TaxID=2956984 RepID=UPI003336D9C9